MRNFIKNVDFFCEGFKDFLARFSAVMTPSKKWYLQLAGNKESSDVATARNLVLANSEGPMKKRNAAEPLGNVKKVSQMIYAYCTYSYMMHLYQLYYTVLLYVY